MPRFLSLLLVAAAFSLAAPVSASAKDAAMMRDDGIHMESWMTSDNHDLKQAVNDAKKAGKRLMIIVEGPGCTACAAMHRTHFQDAKFVKYLTDHFDVNLMSTHGKKNVVNFEGEKQSEKDFTQKNLVRGTPTLMFIDQTGTEFFRIPGLPQAVYFRAFIDYVADGSAEKNVSQSEWWAQNEDQVRARHGV